MKILKFKKISSTQEKAKELTKKRVESWTIVLAKEQTKGIGRKGNFWYSPKGGLYFSIILPKSTLEEIELLNILAAFVVAKVIKEEFSLEPYIKLPNDVYLNNKKICGILTENIILGEKVNFSIMGIGLNTNICKFPQELKNKATSLRIELGKRVNDQKIFEKIIEELKGLFLKISLNKTL